MVTINREEIKRLRKQIKKKSIKLEVVNLQTPCKSIVKTKKRSKLDTESI